MVKCGIGEEFVRTVIGHLSLVIGEELRRFVIGEELVRTVIGQWSFGGTFLDDHWLAANFYFRSFGESW